MTQKAKPRQLRMLFEEFVTYPAFVTTLSFLLTLVLPVPDFFERVRFGGFVFVFSIIYAYYAGHMKTLAAVIAENEENPRLALRNYSASQIRPVTLCVVTYVASIVAFAWMLRFEVLQLDDSNADLFMGAISMGTGTAFAGRYAWKKLSKLFIVEQPKEGPVRGRYLMSYDDVEDASDENEDTLVWGGHALPRQGFGPNFFILGLPGSGKTLSMRMLMRSALRPTADGRIRHRAFACDLKGEMLPVLLDMGIGIEHITLLNPFDKRSVVWRMSDDVQTHDQAKSIAALLFPPPKDVGGERGNHFDRLVPQIATVVIQTLINHPGYPHWSLPEVVTILRDMDRLHEMLGRTERGRQMLKMHFDVGRPKNEVTGSIYTSLSEAADRYDSLVHIWPPDAPPFSLKKWMMGDPSFLLLATPESLAESVRDFARSIFDYMTTAAIDLPNRTENDPRETETWLFLDELKSLPPFRTIGKLLSTGRSKGVRICMGAQDIDGLVETYGRRERVNEMLGLCSNLAVLHVTNITSTEWASKTIGSFEDYIEGTHDSDGYSGSQATHSEGKNFSLRERKAILEQEISNFNGCDFDGEGMDGLWRIPRRAPWTGTIPSQFLKAHIPPERTKEPAFERRDERATNEMLGTTLEPADSRGRQLLLPPWMVPPGEDEPPPSSCGLPRRRRAGGLIQYP